MSNQPPRIETWFPKTVYIRDEVCLDLLPELENLKGFIKFLSPRFIASKIFERLFLNSKKVFNLFFSLSVN